MKTFFQFLEALSGVSGIPVDKMYQNKTNRFHGFNKQDINIFETPSRFKAVINKVEKLLSKVDFVDIHMFIGLPTKDEMINMKKNINPNEIIFVKQISTGDILTPWMLLHTLAHAILDGWDNLEKLSMALDECLRNMHLIDKFRAGLSNITAFAQKPWRDEEEKTEQRKEYQRFHDIAILLFPWKSMRSFSAEFMHPTFDPKTKRENTGESGFQLLTTLEFYIDFYVYWLVKGGKIPINPEIQKYLPPDKTLSDLATELQKVSNTMMEITNFVKGKIIEN
jgi:hypothetical protein